MGEEVDGGSRGEDRLDRCGMLGERMHRVPGQMIWELECSVGEGGDGGLVRQVLLVRALHPGALVDGRAGVGRWVWRYFGGSNCRQWMPCALMRHGCGCGGGVWK